MDKKETLKQKIMLALAHQSYNKGLNLHAFFKVNNHDTGEDLVQETFMKTWKYLVRGGKIDIIKAFLYHVLNNLIIDEYRKRKTTSLEILTEKGFDPHSDDSESERVSNMIDGKSASLFIQKLPDAYKKIMHMKFVQDLTIKEISLITGQTRNAVTVKIHRGLQKLRVLCKASVP
jgi:RNA polymerase sigma-70 factor (ECF subfamily)